MVAGITFFYVGSLFSQRGGSFFPCERGGLGLLFCIGGGGGIIARAFCCHIFYCTDIIIFPYRGGLNFFDGVIRSTKKTFPHRRKTKNNPHIIRRKRPSTRRKWPLRGEKILRHAHRKNTPIGETVSLHEIFLFMHHPPPPPPGKRQS